MRRQLARENGQDGGGGGDHPGAREQNQIQNRSRRQRSASAGTGGGGEAAVPKTPYAAYLAEVAGAQVGIAGADGSFPESPQLLTQHDGSNHGSNNSSGAEIVEVASSTGWSDAGPASSVDPTLSGAGRMTTVSSISASAANESDLATESEVRSGESGKSISSSSSPKEEEVEEIFVSADSPEETDEEGAEKSATAMDNGGGGAVTAAGGGASGSRGSARAGSRRQLRGVTKERDDLRIQLDAAKEELQESQYSEYVAKEALESIKEASGSGESRTTSSSEAELRAQLSKAENQVEKDRSQAELDKSALRVRLAALMSQVESLSYDKHVAQEEAKKASEALDSATNSSASQERERLLQKQVDALRGELEESQYSEFLAKEEVKKIKESTESQGSSLAEEELQATRDEYEEYKRAAEAKELDSEQDKTALKKRLESLRAQLEEAKYGHTAKHRAESESQAELKESQDEVARLGQREEALLSELNSLRAYSNKSMSANLEEQRRVNALIERLRKEVAAERSRADLAQEETKALSSSQTSSSGSQERELFLQKQLKALRGELEESQYSEYLAKEEVKKIKESTESQTSSSEAELASELQATRDAFEEHKIAADKKDADNEVDKGMLRGKLAALKAEVETLTYDKHLAEEEVKKIKGSSSGSHGRSSSEAELIGQVEALERRLRENESQRAEEVKVSDDKMEELLEKLDLAKDQVSVAYGAKLVAEDELKTLRDSSGSSSSGSGGALDSLLQRQVDQLRAEKKLTQQMAMTMKKRLESDKRDLHKRLETVQEEADMARYEKDVAEQELAKEREYSASQTSSEAKELQHEVNALRAELKSLKDSSESHTSSSDADLTRQVEQLEQRLEKERLEHKTKVEDMRGEVEEAQYSEFLAKEEMEKLKQSSSESHTTSSSEAELMSQVAALERKLREKEAKRLEEIKVSDDKMAEMLEKLGAAEGQESEKLAALQAEVQALAYDKHLAQEEVKKMKESSSESQTTSSSEAELMSQVAVLERKLHEKEAQRSDEIKISEDKMAELLDKLGIAEGEASEKAAQRLEEIMASDKKVAELVEKLDLARDQASVASGAKSLAEDELEALKSSSGSGSSSSGNAPDSLLQRQVDQLRAEKRLTQQMAKSMKKRLESDKRDLHKRLETVQEEADAARYAQDVAEQELAKEREYSASQTSSEAKELQREVDALRAELKSLKDSSESNASSSDADLTRQVQQLETRLKAMKGEVEEAQYSEFLAKEEMKKMKESSESQGSSSEAELMSELQATRNAFEEHKLAAEKKDQQSEFDKTALKNRLAELIDEGDKKDEQNEADRSILLDKLAVLKAEMKGLSYDKHLAEEEVKKMKESSSESHTSSSEAELMTQVEALERKLREKEAQRLEEAKASEDAKAQKAAQRWEEIKVSDDKVAALLEQLVIANEKASLARSAKTLAVDELKALKASSESDSASGSGSDNLLQRRIDQLRAEKKLKQREVDALQAEKKTADDDAKLKQGEMDALRAEKKTADDDAAIKQQEFKAKLDALDEEVQAARYAKLLAEGELKKLSDATSSKSVSTEAEMKLREQVEHLQQVIDNVTEGKEAAEAEIERQKYRTDIAEKELKKLRDSSTSQTSSSEMQLQSMVDELQQQVDGLRAEKAASSDEKDSVDRRLEWEKSSKQALREKYEGLQERMSNLQYEKHLAEEALVKLQSSDRESMSSDAESRIAAALQKRVDALEEEKRETLEHVRSLEQKVMSGQSDIQDEATFFRNSQIQSLMKEVDALETTVQSLTARNEFTIPKFQELQESSEEVRRDQCSQYRLMQEELSMEGEEEMPTSVEGQIKFLTQQAASLKRSLRQALKDAEDARTAEKYEKDEVVDLQSRMDKTLLQLQSLKSSTRVAMERIKEDHENALKVARDGASEKLQQENTTLRKELMKNQETMMGVMSQYEAIRVAKEETDHSLRQAEARIKEMDHSLRQAEARMKEMEHHIQGMKTKADITLAQAKKEASSSEEKLHKRIAVTERAHAERISLQEKQIEELAKVRDELHEKNEAIAKELAHERHSHGKLDEATKEHILRLQQEIDAKAEDISVLREQQSNQERNIAALQSSIKEYDEAMKSAQREAAKLREQLSNQGSDLSSKKKLERENAALKASIKECDSTMDTMRREVVELKSTADTALARMEEKKEASDKRSKDLERKLLAAQEEIQKLRDRAARRGQKETTTDTPYQDNLEMLVVELQQENSRLRSSKSFSQLDNGSELMARQATAPGDIATELRIERELREKAEEIAAALARRAKSGFELRNKELVELRAELSFFKAKEAKVGRGALTDGGEASRALALAGQNDALEELDKLRPVVNNLEYLYEMKERSLKGVQSERDEAWNEVRKYKSMAAKLHRQMTEIDQQLEERTTTASSAVEGEGGGIGGAVTEESTPHQTPAKAMDTSKRH